MADSPDLYHPPPHHRRPNLPMLYYGLIVVGTTAIILALYNLIIIKWCSRRRFIQSNTTTTTSAITNTGHSFENQNRYLLSSFKYRRENRDRTECKEQGGEEEESECVVCLASFEEGEEIRQLPRCKHSFHVQCIDMWLYSHSDCPVCRAPVTVLPRFHHRRNNDTAVVDARYHSSRESLAMGPTFAV